MIIKSFWIYGFKKRVADLIVLLPLQRFPPLIRELLVVELYNKLLPQVGDLRERIFNHCELYSYEKTFKEGGEHGVLFFLKSLDLDIRCGYPLGTVCGYGRDK